MSQVSITKRPVLPTIEITKNDASLYTFNPLAGANPPSSGTYDFRLRRLECRPVFDSVAGHFSAKLISTDVSNSGANTLLNNIGEGNEILMYAGKTNSAKVKILRGIIDEIEITEANKNIMEIHLSGPDWGSAILKNRKVVNSWTQDKDQTDPTKLDMNDNKVLIKQIVKDLMQKTQSYPTNNVTAENQGIVVSDANITPPTLRLAKFAALYETLDDKLSELDDMSGCIHYVDPDKNFIMKQIETSIPANPAVHLITDDYTDSIALGWDQTKLGLIAPDASFTKSLESHKRRLFGLGGTQNQIDQSQTTDATQTQLDVNYLAIKFIPQYNHCSEIGVIIDKIGSPAVDLILELREDLGNTPTGSILRTQSKDRTAILGSAAWHYFKMDVDLDTGKAYWIILRKTGDASNTFRWHKNTGTSHTNAYSSDGVSWTTQSSSYGFCFRELADSPLLVILPGINFTGSEKHLYEEVIRRPDIVSKDDLQNLMNKQFDMANKKKEIIKFRVFAPDVMMQPGEKIRVRKISSGYAIDGEFIVGNLEYVFDSSEQLGTGNFYIDLTASRFVTYA